ncbi:MAG: methylmalonyl-CoA mutase family protein [Syntrophales bacterium]
MNEELKSTVEKWEQEKLIPAQKKVPPRQERFTNSSNIEVKPIYTPVDVTDSNYLEDIGLPGSYPYTRGIQPTMYRGRLWSIRQYAGFGTPEESNRRFRFLLEQGQTGLSIAFDLPTQIGLDSDDPMASGEVGRVGVAIDNLQDMETMFKDIPMDKVSTSMTINAPTAVILAMYAAVARRQGVPLSKLKGTLQNDILKEYIARGTYIFPPKPSLRLIADTATYCVNEMPSFNFINIGGYHIREAGANAVQEVGFAFSNAIAYVETLIAAGLDVDQFAPRISWIFNTQNNFFEEVAKYRAARRLWAKITRERFGAKDPRSWMFRTHVQDGGSSLTAQQPLNNLIRGTIHALATVMGGIQSLAICSYDEALAIPTKESATLSVRIQQIIAHESGVADTIDPLAGSYYLESLTNKMEEEIASCIKNVDEIGGALTAIENGYMSSQIEENAYRYQKDIENGKQIIVGLNKFSTEEEQPIKLQPVDFAVEKQQVERLKKLKSERDNRRVNEVLANVKEKAQGNDNIMPALIEAVEAYATLGEICNTLRDVFGEFASDTPKG